MQAQVPIPEDFVPAGRVEEYLASAKRFLENHPSDRFAPRVAFDLYTITAGIGRKEEAVAARSKLLFLYPRSFQAGYLFSTFEDAKEFRNFLNKQTEDYFKANYAGLPEKFCQVFMIGLQRFGHHPDLAGDFSLLLKGFAFSQITGDKQLNSMARQELALKRIEFQDGPFLQTLDLCMNRNLSLKQRVLGLHGIQDGKDALFLKRIFMDRLSAEVQAEPEILRIHAEDALRQRKFEEAMGFISKLPPADRNVPQILFWHALCQFALKRDSDAVKVLGNLYQSHPQSPWATVAKAYGEGILHLESNSKLHVEGLYTFIQTMQKGMDLFQATIEFESNRSNPRKYLIYLGVMSRQNYLEISVSEEGRHLFAYRTGKTESALFLKEEGKIYHFAKPGPIPAPKIQLQKKADGTFYISADASIESSFEQARKNNKGILNSPFLTTPEGLRVLFDYSVRKLGICPLSPIQAENTRTFEWLVPRVQTPELDRLRFQLDSQGRLSGVTFPQFRLVDIEYGGAGEARLTPPDWPSAPVEKQDELNAALFFRVFAALSALAGNN